MEKNDKIEPINYFRESFLHPFNLAFIGLIFIIFLLSTVGLFRELETYLEEWIHISFDITFFSTSISIEMFYLGLVSTFPFFKNLMKKKYAHEMNIINEEINIAYFLSKLNKDYLKKFLVFNQKKKTLIERSIESGATSDGILPIIQENVEKLLNAYAQVLYANQLYENHLKTVDSRQLQMDLFHAEQDLKLATGKKKELLEQQIALLKSRIEKFHHTNEIFSNAEIQLKNIEYTLDVLYENAITDKNLMHMKETIDTIYQETNAYQDAMYEVLSLNTSIQ